MSEHTEVERLNAAGAVVTAELYRALAEIKSLRARLAEAEASLECAYDEWDNSTYRWVTPDGSDYCCRGHWIRQVAWPEIEALRVRAGLAERLAEALRESWGQLSGPDAFRMSEVDAIRERSLAVLAEYREAAPATELTVENLGDRGMGEPGGVSDGPQ